MFIAEINPTKINPVLEIETIYNSSPIGLCVLDNQLRLVRLNQRMADIFGISIDGSIGRTIYEIVPDLSEQAATEFKKVLRNGEFFKTEVCGKTPAEPERQFYWEVRCAQIKDESGQIQGLSLVIIDITQQRQAKEALKESEERFRVLQELSPDGLTILRPVRNAEGQITDFMWVYEKTAIARLNGTDPKEVVGKRLLELFPGHRSTSIFQSYIQVAETGEPCILEAIYNMKSMIRPTWLRMAIVRMNEDIAVLSQDITDRVNTEKALRESVEKAKLLIAELEKADQTKNQFISVLSHELRNPLAAISVGVQLLDVSRDKYKIEKAKEIMKRQTNQLCKLVDDLLELTRITRNKIKLKKENINLNEILKSAVEDIRMEYEKKGVKLGIRIQTKPVLLNADPVRISQAISNMLFNALKFTGENGKVTISLKTEGGNAVISIKDNGMGISPEIMQYIFKPFTQADNSLDRSSGGLGLGLSIVKGIIDLHEGDVSAQSEGLGKGSTFIIRLPITTADTSTEETITSETIHKKFNILLIEDNRDFVEILSSMFEFLGNEVSIALNGTDGIEKAKKHIPDVIFCDIGLPGINGYEVVRKIREDDELKNIYVVALTGYAGNFDAELAEKSGFDKHLAKPVELKTLEKILSEIDR